jgi:multicomponent Na+:H+ antiporter subunit G
MIFLGWILIIIGLFIIISGIVALFRFPDFYTKLHGASVIESCGIPFCLIGLAFMQDNYIDSFKLIIIMLLIFILNPVSSHALGRASLMYKVNEDGNVK